MHTGTSRTYYSMLGVSTAASTEQIKKQYRLHALKLHPDVNTTDDQTTRLRKSDEFKEITEAYTILSNPKTRQTYNESIGIWNTKSKAKSTYGYARQSPKVEKPENDKGYGSGGGVGRTPSWDHATWNRYHYGEEPIPFYSYKERVLYNFNGSSHRRGGDTGAQARFSSYARKRERMVLMEEAEFLDNVYKRRVQRGKSVSLFAIASVIGVGMFISSLRIK